MIAYVKKYVVREPFLIGSNHVKCKCITVYCRYLSKDGISSKSSIYNDFITEEEAYKTDVCNDYKLATDASNSVVRVLGKHSV